MVLAKTELPPDWTPGMTPCDESVGTCVPTFMVAGMLSVAMMLGAEITRVFPLLSEAFSTPSNWLFFDINAPIVRAMPPGPPAAVNAAEGARPVMLERFGVLVLVLLLPPTPVAAEEPTFCK